MAAYGREFAAIYDRAWSPWTDRVWPATLRLARLGAPRGRKWLDLCCGTGGLLKLAARAGYETAGIDLSANQLRFARRNAPRALLRRQDVRRFSVPGRWDVITCMYDSLNYVLTERGVGQALARAKRHLAPGGVLLFDVNTIESHEAFWHHTDIERNPGSVLVVEGTYDRKTRLGRIGITGFVRHGRLWRRFDEEHLQRSYPQGVIEGQLKRLGFRFVTYERGRLSFRRMTRSRRGLLFVCTLK